jgi:hypothetical protein
MDNLESAIADLEEQIAQVRAHRAELDKTLRELESQRRMMADESRGATITAVPIAAPSRLARRPTAKIARLRPTPPSTAEMTRIGEMTSCPSRPPSVAHKGCLENKRQSE